MLRLTIATSAALAFSISASAAAPAVGLIGDKTLVMFDTDTLAVSGTMDVTGVDSLVGIDLRPANGMLIGVTPDNTVVTIDTKSGAATEISKMDMALPMEGGPVIVDFNPAADKLRYMSGTTNHRVDVDTGAVTVDGSLAYEDSDMHKGEMPEIAAAAYINSYGKPDKTAMYDVDSKIGALIRQTSPNDGTLAAIGKFGFEGSGAYAFDVQTTSDMKNTAWLVNGKTLYSVDLETGKADKKGMIEGVSSEIRDITILPKM